MAGIPGVGDLTAAEQISGDCPGPAQRIDLHRQIDATGLDHGLPLEGQWRGRREGGVTAQKGAVGGGLGVGHHRLKADVPFLPAQAVSDHCGFRAEADELSRSGRLGPGVGDAAHAGAGDGHAVALAAVGVGRQIHAVGMQPVHPAVATNNRVVLPWPDPVVAGGRPVQIDDGSHGSTNASLQGGNKGGHRPVKLPQTRAKKRSC